MDTTILLAAIAFVLIVIAVWRVIVGVSRLVFRDPRSTDVEITYNGQRIDGYAPYDPNDEDTEELQYPLYQVQPVEVEAYRPGSPEQIKRYTR